MSRRKSQLTPPASDLRFDSTESTFFGTIRPLFVTVLSLGLVVWLGLPAFAHGEEGESDPVDLVEQALAIVVNTPDAVDEAVERVDEALDAEEAEPSGELNVPALEAAAAALEEGRLHDAEDSLIEAFGQDPHAGAAEPTSFSSTATGEATGEVPAQHGLTERVDGGFGTPSGAGWTAIGLALVAGVIGVVLVRRREAPL